MSNDNVVELNPKRVVMTVTIADVGDGMCVNVKTEAVDQDEWKAVAEAIAKAACLQNPVPEAAIDFYASFSAMVMGDPDFMGILFAKAMAVES